MNNVTKMWLITTFTTTFSRSNEKLNSSSSRPYPPLPFHSTNTLIALEFIFSSPETNANSSSASSRSISIKASERVLFLLIKGKVSHYVTAYFDRK